MKLTLDLTNEVYWRLYCRAVEHGRAISEEVIALVDSGSHEQAPDAEERLAAVRQIRAGVQGGLQ